MGNILQREKRLNYLLDLVPKFGMELRTERLDI